jgi:hypothetical protein
MSAGALNVSLSKFTECTGGVTMIDCGRCVMGPARCRDCAVAVAEPRNVTDRLGGAELRALRVLADAGLVPASAQSWVFPDAKASL